MAEGLPLLCVAAWGPDLNVTEECVGRSRYGDTGGLPALHVMDA